MKLTVIAAEPISSKQHTLELIKNNPLVRFMTIDGKVYRLEMEKID